MKAKHRDRSVNGSLDDHRCRILPFGPVRSRPKPLKPADFSPTPGLRVADFAEDFGPTPGPLTFAPDTLPTARVGEMYEARIRITENVTPVGEFSVSKGSLPAGLELVFVEGKIAAMISGIPEGAGVSTFAISVWCFGTQVSGQSGDKEYTLIVEGEGGVSFARLTSPLAPLQLRDTSAG